jgi:hypothetical protein
MMTDFVKKSVTFVMKVVLTLNSSKLKRFNGRVYPTIIFLFLLSFFGCKKSSSSIEEVIPDEIKQWYLYQTGSYWIYKNEQTLQNDSTYIKQAPSFRQEYFYRDDGSIHGIEDHIDVSYSSKFLKSSDIAPEDVDVNTFIEGIIEFNSNMILGQKYQIDGIFEYVRHFDSLSIDNQYFHDVRQTRFSTVLNNSDTLTHTFYVARHVGLIRLIQTRSGVDTTWSLVRWHAVQ